MLVTKNIMKYFNSLKDGNKENWKTARENLSKNEISFMVQNFLAIDKTEKLFAIEADNLAKLSEWNSAAKNFRENIWDSEIKVENVLDSYEGYLSSKSRNYRLTNRYWALVKGELTTAPASKLMLIDVDL